MCIYTRDGSVPGSLPREAQTKMALNSKKLEEMPVKERKVEEEGLKR